MNTNGINIWKLVLVIAIAVTLLNIFSLSTLQENISGDGVPNRPQREPPIEYPWDQAARIAITAAISFMTAIYSWRKINSNQ